MSVPVVLPPEGDGGPDVGDPVRLFTAPIGSVQFRGQQYDVSSDGQRFLMTTFTDSNSYLKLILDLPAASEGR